MLTLNTCSVVVVPVREMCLVDLGLYRGSEVFLFFLYLSGSHRIEKFVFLMRNCTSGSAFFSLGFTSRKL